MFLYSITMQVVLKTDEVAGEEKVVFQLMPACYFLSKATRLTAQSTADMESMTVDLIQKF